ncbi:MAG: hypothetical protein M0Q92_13865 [Methanoregula sp.]|jgi:hypothetical protein|nr:hypothetical protein [Methanoregula sp.]
MIDNSYLSSLGSNCTGVCISSDGANTVSIGLGEEAKEVNADFQTAHAHYSLPISRTQKIKKFDQLAATWEHDNTLISSSQEMVLLPSYQEIIGMGEDAVPLILEELKNNPQHWFWALRSITGENPVSIEDRGDVKKMTESWLEWGRNSGYAC